MKYDHISSKGEDHPIQSRKIKQYEKYLLCVVDNCPPTVRWLCFKDSLNKDILVKKIDYIFSKNIKKPNSIMLKSHTETYEYENKSRLKDSLFGSKLLS